MTSPVPTPHPARQPARERRQFLLGAFALLLALTLRAPAYLLPGRSRFWIPLAVSVAFAAGAWMLRGVTLPGALAGTAVAFVIFRALAWRGFVVLLTVFVLTWISTRTGRARKRRLGVRDDSRGRSAAQVLANLAVAALLTLFATGEAAVAWIAAAVAALSEAAADTVSSEVGESTGEEAFLITTGERVPAGTDGGVTPLGSAAGFLAAVAVAAVAFALRLLPLQAAGLAAISGVLGAVFDSALGATFERRHLLGNNAVNLISTAFAAGMAVLAAQFLPSS